MKIVLKYVFLAVLFCVTSCSNATTDKNKTVEKATMPVLVEKAVEKITEKETPLKAEISVKELATPVLTAKHEAIPKAKEMVKTNPVIEKETPKAVSVVMKEQPKAVEVPVKEKTPVVEKIKETTEAITPTPKIEVVKPSPPLFTHEVWNVLLHKNVSGTGKVNYKGFKADKVAFEKYLKALAENMVPNSASKAEKMAYWINTYNAFTIKLIVDNYPISSITKLHSGKPWDAKWIKLGGKMYSLNNIEHDILRPQFKDARIHFAVNCAAKSCPPVLNKAWTAKNLNSNLERSAKQFINNTKYNKIGAKEVVISKIFDWYGEDFGDLIGYLNKYSSTKIDAGASVKYMDYEWALNE